MPTKHSQMMYDPETGLSGSDLMHITCRHDTSFETRWQGKGKAGSLCFHHINTRDGIDIWRFQYLCARQINITSKEGPPVFAFRFCLQGETSRHHTGIGRQFYIKGGQQEVSYTTDTENISCLTAKKTTDMIGLSVSRDCLLSWLGDDAGLISKKIHSYLAGTNDSFFCRNRELTHRMQTTLCRMIDCPYTGFTRKLHYESCALELVCLQLDGLRAATEAELSPENPKHGLHPNDRKKIRRVQERINDNPGEVPNLTELAREAGMSQSKLSRLFRQVYGTTVFAYLRNTRLDLAAQMLNQGMSVTETAFSVGYENLSHFSKVFKMRFGKLPSRL